MARLSFAAGAVAVAFSGVAHAALTDTIAQVNATAAELDEAGYARVGVSPFVSNPAGECAPLGCVELVGATGVLPTKGYFQFQFFNYTYNPTFYSGLFAILNIDFSGSTISPQSFLNQVNAQTSTTGVTALFTNQASDAQQTSFFNEWLPTDLDAAIVFSWTPAAPPSGPGLSQVFTFAWDLNDATAFNNGLTLGGVYGVPAPGALALLGLAAGTPRRRRNR